MSFIFQIHRMNYQLKQILEHDKLDLLDTEHIISENRWREIRTLRILCLCLDTSWKDLRGFRMRKILQTEWDGGIKRRWSHLKILSAPNNPTESISTVFSNLSHFQWRNQVRNSFYFFQKQCVSWCPP